LSPAIDVAADSSESVVPQAARNVIRAKRKKDRIYPASDVSSTGAAVTRVDVWETMNWCVLCHT
jgi:hypothetical protein